MAVRHVAVSCSLVLAGLGGEHRGAGSTPEDLCPSSFPAGPIGATPIPTSFNGSEDLSFDGTGGLVAKRGDELVRLDAQGNETVVGQLPGTTFGLRHESGGSLVAARFHDHQVVRISDGVTTTLLEIDSPNGVFPTAEGGVWLTGFGAGHIVHIGADGTATTIVEGINTPNGIVYDAGRNLVFYSTYNSGEVFRVSPDGATEPALVAKVEGANLDGLVLDACGNLYVVDNGLSRLFAVALDEVGNAAGPATLLAELTGGVSNAQFGFGDGWSETSLYVIGGSGALHEVPIGIPGRQ